MFWGSYLAWGNLRCVMLFHLLWLVMRSSHQTRQDLEKLSSFCIPFPDPLPALQTLGVDCARLSSLQAACICETGLFPEHRSEL